MERVMALEAADLPIGDFDARGPIAPPEPP